MNICFMIPSLGAGGAERTVSYLTRCFADEGDRVSVITVFDERFYPLDERVSYHCINVPNKAKYFRTLGRIAAGVRRTRLVRRTLADLRPDVVFCVLTDMVKYLPLSSRRYCLITSERTNPAALPKKTVDRKRRIYRHSDGVVFQTQRAKAFFADVVGDKGAVIQNAVSVDPAKADRSDVKKKFVAVGRLIEAKDYPTMLRAFALFAKDHADYTLDVYGSGPLLPELTALVGQLHLDHAVSFKGTAPDAVYNAADATAFLLSSAFEGMPNVLLEALALGVPCISTDCPNGPGELIENGVNGLLTDVGDPAGLCSCMAYVAEHPKEAAALAENGKKIAETNSVAIISEKYRRYFLSILKQGKEDGEKQL